MHQLTTSIIINATPDEVWLALVDFPGWASWNPFLRDMEGVALKGERVRVTVNPDYETLFERMRDIDPDNMMGDGVVLNKSSSFKPLITAYEPATLLRWKQRHWLTGLYQQSFRLEAAGESGTLFTNVVEMSGFLVNMGWEAAIRPMYSGGMQLMNEGLKRRVEEPEAFNEQLFELRR
ncbi:SRPBCC domain-containing protein [Neolewinella persica]|uniref:SRPBCC domain-containing protein n=1 Tax=Neolewinella persica TaxID=70998 RepID=UPI00037FA4D0|nr:SRPBCC domain-containing protein [Neolewinella persica]